MPRPKQRTPALRSQVLGVAVEMLRRESVGDFTARRVAEKAATSTPAVYELFGDKSGLLRDVFFEGFRLLGEALGRVRTTADARGDLARLAGALRSFVHDNPVLADLMFSRPFAEFRPGPDERAAGDAVRERIVGQVQRAIDAGVLAGDATDIAHVLLALTLGLADAESASRLGTTKTSVNRRWTLALTTILDGFSPSVR